MLVMEILYGRDAWQFRRKPAVECEAEMQGLIDAEGCGAVFVQLRGWF